MVELNHTRNAIRKELKETRNCPFSIRVVGDVVTSMEVLYLLEEVRNIRCVILIQLHWMGTLYLLEEVWRGRRLSPLRTIVMVGADGSVFHKVLGFRARNIFVGQAIWPNHN